MTTNYFSNEITKAQNELKLTDQEILSFKGFENLNEEEIFEIKEMLYNLSFVLLKINNNEPS